MPVNPVLAGGAAVAVSVAVAAAIVMYESPELRRYAEDIRQRIAMAFQSLGDPFNQQQQQQQQHPRFNRPEDADGFLQSSAEPGVDADDETKRRQREELMYWNSVLLKKKEEEEAAAAAATAKNGGGSTFDDFLSRDKSADGETAYVYNTGSQAREADGLRQRHAQYTNPFADEYGIASEDLAPPIPPKQHHDAAMSDIYSATTREDAPPFSPATLGRDSPLVDVSGIPLPPTLERRLAEDEFISAGQDDRADAYASIQAWANDSSRNFYSPLPETPVAPMSEPEVISQGQLTPTDSVSVIGSGETAVSNDDVISESDGILTPVSWSEVGSVVSEEQHQHPVHS